MCVCGYVFVCGCVWVCLCVGVCLCVDSCHGDMCNPPSLITMSEGVKKEGNMVPWWTTLSPLCWL